MTLESKDNSKYIVTMRYTPADEGNLNNTFTTFMGKDLDEDETKIKIGAQSASITTDQQYQLYKVKPTSVDLRSGDVFIITPRYLELPKKFK